MLEGKIAVLQAELTSNALADFQCRCRGESPQHQAPLHSRFSDVNIMIVRKL
jgi:hypothetical protein